MQKNLYKSDANKIISGLIGGLGEYFGIDPALLRVGWILIVAFTGIVPGVIAYLIGSLVVPTRNA